MQDPVTPAPTDAQPISSIQPPPGPSGIQPGETLDVFVMEDDSFSGSYEVRSTGHIIIPKFGRVHVGGMSAAAAEKALSKALETDQLTSATVIVDRADLARLNSGPASTPGTQIFLSGKVTRPGRYTVLGVGDAPPTVHQAILQAGGCTRFAHKRKVHILRRFSDGRLRRVDADLEAIESGLIKDVPLAPGDIVVVPEKKVDFGI